MKSYLSSLALTVLLATANVVRAGQEHADDHEGMHQCACEAEELGFAINCEDTNTMLASLSTLQSSGCASNCSSDECVKAWFIVQSHHDYCPEEGLPEEIEDGFHDYDTECESCSISRKPIEGLPNCPEPNCEDNSGNTAYATLIGGACSFVCGDDCVSPFRILRAVHDNCPHEALTQEAEEGIHDLEVSCAMMNCNSGGGKDPLVCEAHDSDDTSAASVQQHSLAVGLVLAAAFAVAMM